MDAKARASFLGQHIRKTVAVFMSPLMTLVGKTTKTGVVPVAVAVVSSGLLLLYQMWLRAILDPNLLSDGYRFQAWSSNWMMQNLGLEDMAAFGPLALWLKHAYPPGLDAIRYILMMPEWGSGNAPDPIAVDMRLYLIYGLLYGVTNAVAYAWVRDLTGSERWGLVAATLWAIAPGHVMAATLLEPTELSLAFVSLSFFYLYRFLRTRRPGYATAFLSTLFVASMARSFIQVYVLAILIIAVISFFFMTNRRYRRWAWAMLNGLLLILIFAYPVKQFVLFDTWSTTTFGGYHRVGMLHLDPRNVLSPVESESNSPSDTWAKVERELALKSSKFIVPEPPQAIVDNALVFSSRYNTQELVRDNYRLETAANQFLRAEPFGSAIGIGKSLAITLPEALNPTSIYTNNVLVEHLPYRAIWDWLISGWRLLLILGATFAWIIHRYRLRGTWRRAKRYAWLVLYWILIALPVILSNRYYPGREDEGPIWTDVVRQKLFLAMPISVVVIASFAGALAALRARVKPKPRNLMQSNE